MDFPRNFCLRFYNRRKTRYLNFYFFIAPKFAGTTTTGFNATVIEDDKKKQSFKNALYLVNKCLIEKRYYI